MYANPPSGSGGQNYGNVTVAGSGIYPGGTTVSYYPGIRRGEAGYPGCITIILRKKLNAFVKDSGSWANVSTVYTKISSEWKQVQAAWTKVSGQWKPILTDKGIPLYNYPVKRKFANIIISSDTNDYNLYNNLPTVYFEGLMDVSVWVLPGVVITGNSTSTAFTVNDFSPGDRIQLNNYGTIQGGGGQGGNGGFYYTSGKTTYAASPTAGGSGGTGLLLQFPILLNNLGNIAGGGGGGGGGGATGSQGGGGAGFGIGYNNGTLTTGGAGGTSGYDGGAGGSRGLPGVSGQSGALGGAAGYAIVGVSTIVSGSTIGTYNGPIAS